MRLPRLTRFALGPAAVLVMAACGHTARARTPAAHASIGAREWTTTLLLHGKPLEVHLSEPARPTEEGLVLYASGDGGWFGAAVDMFRQIAGAGYYAVGFSSRAFLRIERPHGRQVTTADLTEEYRQILADARAALHVSDESGVVLTGWSRGAAFAVLVGSEPPIPPGLLGVVAIGLAEDEDLGSGASPDDGDDEDAPARRTRGAFDTYARIAHLGSVRCAVIQSTHDGYLPAARAQRLFGPTTPQRRFYAVEASNHRFSGGKASFDAALIDALRWITAPRR